MNGVLGGFKNMLKQWHINLKNKKIRKQKISQKKHYRFTTTLYSVIAIIICPIGLTLNSKNNSNNNSKSKINKDEVNLNKNIINNEDELSSNLINSPLKNKITDKKIKKSKKSSATKSILPILHIVKEKRIEDTPISKNNSYTKNIKTSNKLLSNDLVKVKKKFNQKNKIKANKKSISTLKKDVVIINEKIIYKQIKDIGIQIKEIESEIISIVNYNDLYDCEKQLKELMEKVQDIKENYHNFSNVFLMCVETLDIIEEQCKNVSNKKDELYYKKTIDKIDSMDSKKSQQIKKTTNITKKINENIKAQKIIFHDIINQNKLLEEYFIKFNKASNKKNITNNYLKHFSSNLLTLTISFFSIPYFYNPFLKYLVNAYMVNNSIKTMRKVINPKLIINYSFFLSKYKNNIDMLIDFKNLCDNSLTELQSLKEEIKLFGNTELLKEIELIEANILKQKKQIKINNDIMDKVYVKVRDSLYE